MLCRKRDELIAQVCFENRYWQTQGRQYPLALRTWARAALSMVPAAGSPRSALPCYLPLLELFHEVTYQTAHGQLLDTTTAPVGKASRGPAHYYHRGLDLPSRARLCNVGWPLWDTLAAPLHVKPPSNTRTQSRRLVASAALC
jgi:hypothetical protein